LSFRDVEELLAKRGIFVTHETIRQWCRKFGPEYARRLKQNQGRLGDIWHLDEVFMKIDGARRYLWRAVDQDGTERYANNLAEVSHQPTRQRERQWNAATVA
jgi:putative transposase